MPGADGYHKVPDDWEPAPKGIEKQRNVDILLQAGALQVRQLPGGVLEWRRTPQK